MVSYPKLTAQQQQGLPALLQPAKPMLAKFEDSTHRLWSCETSDGAMVLKFCNLESVQQSSFWLGMNSLFDIAFPLSLGMIETTHRLLIEHGGFKVPSHIASEASSYVLSRFIAGQDITEGNVTDDLVKRLAQHLACLHQQSSANWGSIHQPQLTSEQWPKRLQQTLDVLIDKQASDIPAEIIEQAMTQLSSLQVDNFVPIMVDLRWDQLRVLDTGDIAVVDLDAFVIGPRELELVLVEYLLTAQQAAIFKTAYQQHLSWPDLSNQRLSYRLLLFLMNVLGETDLDKWLNHRVIA